MARKSISVTHEEKSVKFPEFSSNDPLVYELFNKLSSDEYENSFNAMLHIGALALMEDRIQHLIDSAEKEIYPQLERFKLMFEICLPYFEHQFESLQLWIDFLFC